MLGYVAARVLIIIAAILIARFLRFLVFGDDL